MTPDIREKAERLWRDELGFVNDRFGFVDILSQALLEAHKAGREEAMAEINAERELSPEQAAELREAVSNTLATEDVQEVTRQGNALLRRLRHP